MIGWVKERSIFCDRASVAMRLRTELSRAEFAPLAWARSTRRTTDSLYLCQRNAPSRREGQTRRKVDCEASSIGKERRVRAHSSQRVLDDRGIIARTETTPDCHPSKCGSA